MLKGLLNGVVTLTVAGSLMYGVFSRTAIDVEERKPVIVIIQQVADDDGYTHTDYGVHYMDGDGFREVDENYEVYVLE